MPLPGKYMTQHREPERLYDATNHKRAQNDEYDPDQAKTSLPVFSQEILILPVLEKLNAKVSQAPLKASYPVIGKPSANMGTIIENAVEQLVELCIEKE